MSEITLRCNMCGSEFEDDYDLATCIYDEENDESHDGCPHCMTDEYIMSIEPTQPTNHIDSFITSGGFDKAMGGKNGE